MKRKFLFRCLLIGHCLATMIVSFCAGQLAGAEDVPPYLLPNLPIDTRVRDLLSRMTLDEKIGQMVQADLGALADGGRSNVRARLHAERGQFQTPGQQSGDVAIYRTPAGVLGFEDASENPVVIWH